MEIQDLINGLCTKLGLDRDGDTVVITRRPATSGYTNSIVVYIQQDKGIIEIMD